MTNLIDSQAVWSLRPDDIPGQVMRDSRSSDTHVRLKVDVALKGPDGNLLGEADFAKIGSLPRVNKGHLVLFRVAKAGQQLYIDKLRIVSSPADREDYNKAKSGFSQSYIAKVDKLVSDLEANVEDLAVRKADEKMAPERIALDTAWGEHRANIEKYNENRQALKVAFSAIATEQAHWDKEQQQIQVVGHI